MKFYMMYVIFNTFIFFIIIFFFFLNYNFVSHLDTEKQTKYNKNNQPFQLLSVIESIQLHYRSETSILSGGPIHSFTIGSFCQVRLLIEANGDIKMIDRAIQIEHCMIFITIVHPFMSKRRRRKSKDRQLADNVVSKESKSLY